VSRRFQRSFTADEVRQWGKAKGVSPLEAKARLATEGLLAEIADLRHGSVEDQLDFLLTFVEGLVVRSGR
jgi:hypothetical protein